MKATTKFNPFNTHLDRKLLQRLKNDDSIAHPRKELETVIAVSVMTEEEYATFEDDLRKYNGPRAVQTRIEHIKRLQPHIEWLKNRIVVL